MTEPIKGPPEMEAPGPANEPGDHHEPHGHTDHNAEPDIDPYDSPDPAPPTGWAPAPRQCRSTPEQLRSRRGTAHRSVPLHCGHRDPWTCGCYRTEPPLSNHALDGWRDAALQVLSVGEIPLLPIEVLRALWLRGGADRVLAIRLHEACGGEAA